jgi:hypothetical protein
MLHSKLTRTALKPLAALFLVLCWCSASSGQTTTNILDNFNRNGALGGSSPDIGDVNSSPTNWVGAFTTTTAGGGAMIENVSGNGANAQLPFAPQSGYVYTLSVTVKIAGPDPGADRWAAVGFGSASGVWVLNTTGPWMIMKPTGRMESYYNGLNSAIASADHAGYGAGTNNLLQIVLDTTSPSNWKTQIKVNGANFGTPTALPSGFTISYVTLFTYGSAVGTNTHLSVTSVQPAAPVISGQPIGFTNWAGVSGSMEVAASGSQPMSYQWYTNSTAYPLSGQTGESLSFSPLQGTDSGSYFVVITNSYGAVTSSVAAVHVETGTVMTLTPSISVGALPASGTDDASGINSTNTYLCALDFTTGSTPQVINGVTFAPVTVTNVASASGTDPVNGGSWSLASRTVFGVMLTTTSGSLAGEADGVMGTLLTDALSLQNPEQADSMTLTFGNVIPTGQYRIRLYYQQWSANTLPVIFTFNGHGSNEVVQLDENLGTSINSSGAYYIDYVFTAVTNSASVTLAVYLHATGTPYLYGAVLQQVSAPLVPPSISAQPAGFTNWVGYSGSLSVTAGGSVPLHYQWYQNSAALTTQTNSVLNFAALDPSNNGAYRVVIANAAGSVTSSVANVFTVTSGVWTYTPSISAVQIPATGSDTSAGIDPTNLYLCALDFGGITTPVSINGVNFSHVNVSGNGSGTGYVPLFSGVDANYGGGWSLTGFNSSANGINSLNTDSPGTVGAQADGSLQSLLTDVAYLNGNPLPGDPLKLTLTGVSPGGKYSLRFYYRSWDYSPRLIDFTFNGQGTDETVRVNMDNGGANYLDYEFTAANTNVSLNMTMLVDAKTPLLYGVTLAQTAAPPVPPSITAQPSGFTNWVNSSGSLGVAANGALPLAYQWYQNGSPLSGQTSATLNFASLAATDSGAYRVVITNSFGSVTSSVANVFVVTNGVWTYTPSISVVQIPATGSDAASGIASTNTYLAALDFGDDTTELAINGVNFTQVSVAGNGTGTANLPEFSGVDTNYGGSWSLTASNTAGNAAGFAGLATDAAGNVTSQADGNMQLMLTDITYIFGAIAPGDFGRLTLGGLTPGGRYSLRYYYRQWSSNRPIDFTFDGDGTNETVQVDLDAGGANYVNYEFTAAGTNVTLTLTVNVTQQGPHFYGVTLQQTAAAATAPQLHIARSGSQVTISWDAAYSGFTLQSTTNLTNPNWTAVPGITTNGMTVANPAGNTFFRLRN